MVNEEDKYYVYWHLDGEEIVYVGKGRYQRAWTPHNRCKEHAEWMKLNLPWVEINFVAQGLTNEEAKEIEVKHIKRYNPKWNRQHTGRCDSYKGEKNNKAKLTEDEVILIKYLLAPLLSRRKIAEEFGVSKTTINKIINNQAWSFL